MGEIKSFKQLRIWQEGIDIVKQVYAITKRFPADELYGLTGQMRRAAVSIPSNIAEGFKRSHHKEYKQFLHVALGSAAELETQAIIASELNFLNTDQFSKLTQALDRLSKMVTVLVSRLT